MDDLQAQLRQLRQSYVTQLSERISQVQEIWTRLVQGDWDSQVAQELHRLAHKYAGSGATFGFVEISSAARVLELSLQPLVEQGITPTADYRAQIRAHLEALGMALQDAESAGMIDWPGFAPRSTTAQHEQNRLIYLVEDDTLLAHDLALQIRHFGYSVQIFSELEGLDEAMRLNAPAAIIMDVVFPAGAMAGPEAAAEIQRSAQNSCPFIFISARADLLARLEAVRAGASAYFVKPLNVSSLIDTLDDLTAGEAPEPFRILVIDDDVPLAAYYALVLEGSGAIVEVASEPLAVLDRLADFRPDLILMDVYMPEVDGRELAAVIRQQETYVGIPIVFLSSEGNLERQLAALRLGGDDFLTKPIDPDHLVSAVTSRARRARDLRALMVRDSLTGLLNHTTLKERLEDEVSRAQRQDSSLAFALIDIDHFKSINDTYGHPTGDRVLRSLSRLLQQRLRRSDTIGRYGGEEFGVILPDADASTACDVLDEIRAGFAQLRHHYEGIEFSVTFSGGIAVFPAHADAIALSNAADRALYEAKRRGRNRVSLASQPEAAAALQQATDTRALAAQPPAMARVLVADDDPHMSQLLEIWLASAGYGAEVVLNVDDALTRLIEAPPDLILLDVVMPGTHGLQLLKEVRARQLDMAVIIMTGLGSEQVAVEALRLGADDYLRKPVELGEFQVVLERVLSRLQLSRQNARLRRLLEEKRHQLEGELSHAARVQAELLPRSYPRLPGFDLAALCLPAREVGGDFYDWHMPNPELLTLTLGDVAGKGMPAALLMATVRAAMRAVVRQSPPADAMRYVAGVLESDLLRAEEFVTLFLAQLDLPRRQLSYVDAGHGYGFVRRADGAVELLGLSGPPLGAAPGVEYQQGVVDLHPGDVVVLCSDGLVESRPDRGLTPPALAAVLDSAASAAQMANRLVELTGLAGAPADDMTVLVLRCKR